MSLRIQDHLEPTSGVQSIREIDEGPILLFSGRADPSGHADLGADLGHVQSLRHRTRTVGVRAITTADQGGSGEPHVQIKPNQTSPAEEPVFCLLLQPSADAMGWGKPMGWMVLTVFFPDEGDFSSFKLVQVYLSRHLDLGHLALTKVSVESHLYCCNK